MEFKNKTRLISQTGYIYLVYTIHDHLAWKPVWKWWCVFIFFIMV